MKCKNKEILVRGIVYIDATQKLQLKELRVIITNDERGKTLSIDDGAVQFSIPFEKIEKYLR